MKTITAVAAILIGMLAAVPALADHKGEAAVACADAPVVLAQNSSAAKIESGSRCKSTCQPNESFEYRAHPNCVSKAPYPGEYRCYNHCNLEDRCVRRCDFTKCKKP